MTNYSKPRTISAKIAVVMSDVKTLNTREHLYKHNKTICMWGVILRMLSEVGLHHWEVPSLVWTVKEQLLMTTPLRDRSQTGF